MGRTILAIAIACVLANYGYQLMHLQEYAVALERTYFQLGALGMAYIALKGQQATHDH